MPNISGAGGIAGSSPLGLPTFTFTLIPKPIPWKDIEDAIYNFFVSCTGLQVIWEDQSTPRPSYPYGSLRIISGPTSIGMDETRLETVTNPPVGTKLQKLISCGSREMTCSFKVFGTPSSIDPFSHARAYEAVLRGALELPIFRSILSAVGLAFRGQNPISLPDQQIDNTWISRSVLDVRFGLSSNMEQQMDVIETAHIKAVGDGLGSLPAPTLIDQDFGGTP